MKNQSFGRQVSLTPWHVVQRRFFEGLTPDILAFSAKHNLKIAEVLKLFSGRVISFSLEMCAALSKEARMSTDFFRNLSNRWPPQLPPAVSAALSLGPFFYKNTSWACGTKLELY